MCEALGGSALSMLDVGDPAQDHKLASLGIADIEDIDAEPDHLYVLDGDGLGVYSIGDLTSGDPEPVRRAGGVGNARRRAARGRRQAE